MHTTIESAIGSLEDGQTVGIGGYYFYRHPMAFVREIIRSGVKDLTLVTPLASIEADMLIGAGCVKKIIFGFVSFDVLGLAPNFRRACEEGALEALEYGDMPLMRSFEAASRDIPFLPTRCLTGTDLLERHPAEPFKAPDNETLMNVPQLTLDVMLVHGQWADGDGNLVIDGEGYDVEMVKAARRVYATVERIVGRGELRSLAGSHVPRYHVDALVESPFSAHPTSCYPRYAHDLWHLSEYVDYATSGRFDEYLQRHVHSTSTEAQYLETVGGPEKLLDLQLLMQAGRRN